MPPRVLLFANPDKPHVADVRDDLASWLRQRADLTVARAFDELALLCQPPPDLIVVVGGDGTILRVGRQLDHTEVPIVGVNVGKLGYLAEFSADDLRTHFERLTDPVLIAARMMIRISRVDSPSPPQGNTALNDCVITAGPPFRMIRLGIAVDGVELTRVRADGLIVATPTGSTAHNLAAGGPILQPGLQAIVITPICPHSVTHRPLVVSAEATIEVAAEEVNTGSTIILDGQESFPLARGDRLQIRRAARRFLLVRNPAYPAWHTLLTKLRWGESPGDLTTPPG